MKTPVRYRSGARCSSGRRRGSSSNRRCYEPRRTRHLRREIRSAALEFHMAGDFVALEIALMVVFCAIELWRVFDLRSDRLLVVPLFAIARRDGLRLLQIIVGEDRRAILRTEI